MFQYIITHKNRNKILLPNKGETQSCNKLVERFFMEFVIYIVFLHRALCTIQLQQIS